jgi:predicted lysophospholipase L1 biosynthesis ABC-type transport system permease subunit
MAVSHQLVDTGAADGSLSSLLALDAAVAPGIVALRPDLTATGTTPYDALGRSSADGDGLPALATTALLAERGLRVGDRLDTIVGRSQVPVRVVGEVSGFPTLGSTDGLVVDATMLRRATGGQGSADQWWYAVDEGAATQAGAALAADPVVAAVSDRWTLAAALEQDPLAQGFTGSLQIALIVGTVLAAMGYGVSVLLSGRERRSELLLLRALGGSPREVRSALVIEQLLVLGLGIALGLVVGLVVAALVVPLTTVSARTGAVVPPAVTTVPWAHLIILVLGLVTVLVAVSAVVTSRVGRAQIATGLRQEVAP